MTKLKSVACLLCIALATRHAKAQVVTKGEILGGINVSGQNYGNFDSLGSLRRGNLKLNFAPHISYAIGKNQTVGAYMLLNNSNGSNFNFSKYNHDFAVGIYTRRYFSLGKKWYAYGQGDVQYATTGDVQDGTPVKYVTKSFNMSLSAGLGYRINKRLLLEVGFNNLVMAAFNRSTTFVNNTPVNTYKFNEINFRNLTQRNGLHIGLTYRFR
jgi:hypothetical protein